MAVVIQCPSFYDSVAAVVAFEHFVCFPAVQSVNLFLI